MLNDTAYPGWEVEIDGKRAHWFRADYLFRGVLTPSGDHVVRFVFRPASFRWGSAIALSALLTLIFVPLAKRTWFAESL
jgi:uncharacterized membrane protein YfhO